MKSKMMNKLPDKKKNDAILCVTRISTAEKEAFDKAIEIARKKSKFKKIINQSEILRQSIFDFIKENKTG